MIKTNFLYLIPFLLVAISSLPSILVQAQEIQDNEIIPHRDLAISYVIGRDGSITAKVLDESFTIQILELSNHFWNNITKSVIDENITIIDYANGQNTVSLTLNMSNNFLQFDLEGRLIEANLMRFQFSNNVERLEENRTGLRLKNGGLFYFDWSDINLETEYIEGSKTLRIDIRSAPTFKLDPRLVFDNPDFETGDYTGWAEACSTGSQAVNSTNPINGSESNRVAFLTGSTSNNCYTRQGTFTSAPDAFMQHQWRIESVGSWDDNGRRDISRMTSSNQLRITLQMRWNATRSAFQFQVAYRDDIGAISHRNQTFPNIDLTATYCAELYYQRDNAGDNLGIAQVWINNTQYMNIETVDNNAISPVNRMWLGQQGNEDGGAVTYRTDDLYGSNSLRINTCPEGLSSGEPPIIPEVILPITDFVPIAINGIFLSWIAGGAFITLGHKRNVFITAIGMILLLSGFMLQLNPIYATINNDSLIAYERLDFDLPTRNNFALISTLLIGVGIMSMLVSSAEKTKRGARNYLFG